MLWHRHPGARYNLVLRTKSCFSASHKIVHLAVPASATPFPGPFSTLAYRRR